MGSNNFITLATIPPGTPTGPLAAIDLWTLVSPTGLNPGITVICSGDFEGAIGLEGSIAGTNFAPVGVSSTDFENLGIQGSQKASVGAFKLGKRANVQPISPTYELSPLIIPNVIRYLRVNVQPGTLIRGTITVTIGGQQNCDCAGGGGGGSARLFSDTVRSNPTDVDGAMTLDLFPSQFNASSLTGTNAGDVTLSAVNLTLATFNADAGALGEFQIVTLPYGSPPFVETVVYTLAVGALPGDGSVVNITDDAASIDIADDARWFARIVWEGGDPDSPDSGAVVDAALSLTVT